VIILDLFLRNNFKFKHLLHLLVVY